MVRNDVWLLSRLDHLWSNYFSDVPQINPVFIKFGRFARLRFGSIRMDPSTPSTRLRANPSDGKLKPKRTVITITGMFKDERIPQEVVDHTIAHELCHYVHGFSSPHKRLHRFPHEGGVIKDELENRGLIHLYKEYREWIKEYREELREHYKRDRD